MRGYGFGGGGFLGLNLSLLLGSFFSGGSDW
jgi:hypothetical protein